MIRLEVEEYCHSCPEFTASVNKVTSYGNNEVVERDIYITCRNEGLCRHIRDYMQQCGNRGGSKCRWNRMYWNG